MADDVAPSSHVAVAVSLSESLSPGRWRCTVLVTCSTRSGWWVSCVSGGMGMLRLASRLTSTLTAWMA